MLEVEFGDDTLSTFTTVNDVKEYMLCHVLICCVHVPELLQN